MSVADSQLRRSASYPPPQSSRTTTSFPSLSRKSKNAPLSPAYEEKPTTSITRESTVLRMYSDLKQKNSELEKQRDEALRELEEIRTRIDQLAHHNSRLQKDFSNDWGKVIRKKDEEIRRCKEEIRKLESDRSGVMVQKTIVETNLIDLKGRLKEKSEKIAGIKQIQKIQCKSKLISDTERIRNERNEALASLDQREKLVTSMKLQLLQLNKLNEQRTKQLEVMQKKMSSKEKYVKELEKQLMTYNSGIFFDYFKKAEKNSASKD